MMRLSRFGLFPALGATLRVLYAATLVCGWLGAIFLVFHCLGGSQSSLAQEAAEPPANHSTVNVPLIGELMILAVTTGGFGLSGVLVFSTPHGRVRRAHEFDPGIIAAEPDSEERGWAEIPAGGEAELVPTTSGWKEPPLAKAPTRDCKNLRILAVDDNPVNRKILTALLGKQGNTVVEAGNGEEALDIFETQAFDVILMDIEMPQLNGFEATAGIRRREIATGRHIPIVAVSAHAMSGFKERCLAAGMDQYVSLPLRTEELFAAVAESLKGAVESTVCWLQPGKLSTWASAGQPTGQTPASRERDAELKANASQRNYSTSQKSRAYRRHRCVVGPATFFKYSS